MSGKLLMFCHCSLCEAIAETRRLLRTANNDKYLTAHDITHPTKETGFFDENTSFLPTYELKNPVSGPNHLIVSENDFSY